MIQGVEIGTSPRVDVIDPNNHRLVGALRQIGYSFEQAVADLVDNAISADAKTILIRFLHDGESVIALAVADDGDGMDSKGLKEAMRFGSRRGPRQIDLGKFGMGLKLASLSHAKTLTVLSKAGGAPPCGRKWELDSIGAGWQCNRIPISAVHRAMALKWGPISFADSGTIILWEDIDKLPKHRSGIRYTLSLLERRLRLSLGLSFHRFLARGVKILLDQTRVDKAGQSLNTAIDPLDPFGYHQSGLAGYPMLYRSTLNGCSSGLEFEAHVWPANDQSENYRLGRRAASRQGFYIYRNDRLIQAGGWNGIVHDDNEPHSSLARVRIDLPRELEDRFGLNVQKSTIITPPGFESAISEARSNTGAAFEDFRRDAIAVYRDSNSSKQSGALLPSGKRLKGLRRYLQNSSRTDSNPIDIRLDWRPLANDKLLRLTTEPLRLTINADLVPDASAHATIRMLVEGVLLQSLNDVKGKKTTAELLERHVGRLNDLIWHTLNGAAPIQVSSRP